MIKKDIISVATYRYEDWKQLLDISDDRSSLEETWLEWNDHLHKFEDDLLMKNVHFQEVLVDLDELRIYCDRQGLKIDSKSRSSFVSEKALTDSLGGK